VTQIQTSVCVDGWGPQTEVTSVQTGGIRGQKSRTCGRGTNAKKNNRKENLFFFFGNFLTSFECLYLMQFYLDFRIYFFDECGFKSELHCKEKFQKAITIFPWWMEWRTGVQRLLGL
jgi:hypothetical protein